MKLKVFSLMKNSLLLLFFIITFSSFAQRQKSVNSEVWFGFMTSGQIAPKWSLWLDTHHVPDLFLILRGGLTYHTADQKFALTAGYARLGLATPFSEGSLIRPENRPWGQIVFRVPSKNNFSASFRYRHDMRYRANLTQTEVIDGFSLNHRLRFNVSLRYNWKNALSPHFNFSTTLFNESLFTQGPAPSSNPFEHRTFLLFSFQKKTVTFSPGYHIRFSLPTSNTLVINHGLFLWINVNYKFKDFRRHTLKEFPGDHI
ncbi:Protein of unknown function [Aquiflexum balticum DSM 16537]|uniref:DUF2490 domain-containing protein n=1 Tax=Aquiflexum balticum DSM 16537 TaxID=758820 RepID=A0A1W2H950_9BACT|nr:Protein of unknown function [Aquiflexum balticum DSM 16537]